MAVQWEDQVVELDLEDVDQVNIGQAFRTCKAKHRTSFLAQAGITQHYISTVAVNYRVRIRFEDAEGGKTKVILC